MVPAAQCQATPGLQEPVALVGGRRESRQPHRAAKRERVRVGLGRIRTAVRGTAAATGGPQAWTRATPMPNRGRLALGLESLRGCSVTEQRRVRCLAAVSTLTAQQCVLFVAFQAPKPHSSLHWFA